ncbi:glycosyltransferase family 39 protein [Oribacterium sp. FC2011]|uniref:glycosyltransferase family 39 protein n=1 Tax=Oribacterium sp. FC2011 TaxID=1408311 RepID=UPI0004E1D55E|nr:glycosyltransferase family 39 protein [Oribacterium sp. FC2011]
MNISYKDDLHKHWLVIATVVLSIIGFIMRVICCFWGAPLQLHPDEPAIVDWAIEMIKRHSWEAHFYDRPDHFEMKFNAIIFTLYSWLRYKKPAYEAFDEHKMDFYILARLFTTIFGTALISLVGVYSQKIFGFLKGQNDRIVSIIAMVLITFSPIFVQHSAYATPDMVLTFFLVLFAFGFQTYIDSGSKKFLYLDITIIGIGITIKYPAAFLCIPLALMVIYRALLIDKKPLDILKYAAISIGLIILTVFVIAPNLITDFVTVYRNIMEEARPNHLGADGLGFGGNFKFYFDTIKDNLGRLSMIPFVLGIICIIGYKKRSCMSLMIGLIFWICMSALSLHWLRWGIPMYPFYIIIASFGGVGTIEFVGECITANKWFSFVGRTLVIAFIGLLIVNAIFSGVCITICSSLMDIRRVAMKYCKENDITVDNSIYEVYTPLAPGYGGGSCVNLFFLADNVAKVKIEHASKKYFVMSNSFKDRYLAEKDIYVNESAIYNAIESTYEIIYREGGKSNYVVNKNIFLNIENSIRYLVGNKVTTGDIITVYDLKPVSLTIQNMDGYYVSAPNEDTGTFLQLSPDTYSWVLYNDNNIFSFLSSQSGNALDVTGAIFEPGINIELCEPTGDAQQQWRIETDGEWNYLVTNGEMALSFNGDKVVLEDYTQADNQKLFFKYQA